MYLGPCHAPPANASITRAWSIWGCGLWRPRTTLHVQQCVCIKYQQVDWGCAQTDGHARTRYGILHITNPVVLVMTWCLFSAKSLAEPVVTSTQKSSLVLTISVVYNWYQPGGEHVHCFYHTGIGIWRFSYSGGNWEKFAWYWTDTESWPPSVIFMCLVILSWYLWTDSSI